MSIDYMEVMGVFGGLTARHPQTVSLILQTYNLWNNSSVELNKIYGEYNVAAAKATGPLDQAGIVMQLMAIHPSASALLKQTLTMWQTRIPDLLQIIDELQAASTAAAKT